MSKAGANPTIGPLLLELERRRNDSTPAMGRGKARAFTALLETLVGDRRMAGVWRSLRKLQQSPYFAAESLAAIRPEYKQRARILRIADTALLNWEMRFVIDIWHSMEPQRPVDLLPLVTRGRKIEAAIDLAERLSKAVVDIEEDWTLLTAVQCAWMRASAEYAESHGVSHYGEEGRALAYWEVLSNLSSAALTKPLLSHALDEVAKSFRHAALRGPLVDAGKVQTKGANPAVVAFVRLLGSATLLWFERPLPGPVATISQVIYGDGGLIEERVKKLVHFPDAGLSWSMDGPLPLPAHRRRKKRNLSPSTAR